MDLIIQKIIGKNIAKEYDINPNANIYNPIIQEYNTYTKSKDEPKYYFLNRVPSKDLFKLEVKDAELELTSNNDFALLYNCETDSYKLYTVLNSSNFYYVLILTRNILYSEFIKLYIFTDNLCVDKIITIFEDSDDIITSTILDKLNFIFNEKVTTLFD